MTDLWSRKQKSQFAKDQAATRLDCFLTVVYLFPNCLDPADVDAMALREKELTKIYVYSGRGFFASYALASLGSCMMRGRLPFFSQVMKHSILAGTGTFVAAALGEKVGAELYYNKLLIQLADKYNFTPEEV